MRGNESIGRVERPQVLVFDIDQLGGTREDLEIRASDAVFPARREGKWWPARGICAQYLYGMHARRWWDRGWRRQRCPRVWLASAASDRRSYGVAVVEGRSV